LKWLPRSRMYNSAVRERRTRKRSKLPSVLFVSLANRIRHHTYSLLPTLLAVTLVFKYLHGKRKPKGSKSGGRADQETAASRLQPIQRPG
jgi:hypothetical protein